MEKEEEKPEKSNTGKLILFGMGILLGILIGFLITVPTIAECNDIKPQLTYCSAELLQTEAQLTQCSNTTCPTTGGLSTKEIKSAITKFIVANGVDEADINIANMKSFTSDFYQLDITVGGQAPGTYVATKDGKYLIWGNYLMDLVNLPEPVEAQKTEKATGTLYVFSYCPAGTAALSTFAEVAKFFGNKANMEVKFFSNMHGDHEKLQNITQECIQKIAKDKYWDYVELFVKDIYPNCKDTKCDKEKSIIAMKAVGIDSNAVYECVDNGQTLYDADIASATELEITASPSLAVNGTSFGSKFDRSAEGIKATVCSGFITAPTDCNTALGTGTATASGSC